MGKLQLAALPPCSGIFQAELGTRLGAEGRGGSLMCRVLEVSDAARHTHHIALSLSLYRSDNGFGYAFGIDTSSWRKLEMDEPEERCKIRM